MEIKITATIPHPIVNLAVISNYPEFYTSTDFIPSAILTFSAENASTLNVTGDVDIKGILKTEDRDGAKSHTLSIGRNLHVGVPAFNEDNCYCTWALGELHTIAMDDKINITFNTTDPTSRITGPIGINFYDVTFNGTGIIVATPISIAGTATFINGIVNLIINYVDENYYHLPGDYGGSVNFYDDAGHTGGSNISYVEGGVSKSGNDPFTFPIGQAGIYAPITISAPPSNENFYASYGRLIEPMQNAIGDPDLFSISNCEYWILKSSYQESNYLIDVTVGWTHASACASSPGYISNVSDIRLAYADFNGTWNSHGEPGTGTISNGSVSMKAVLPDGYFTLGNVGTNCRPPTYLTTSNITSKAALVEWTPVANALSYDLYYKTNYQSAWTNVTNVTPTSVNLTGLSPLINYNWKVRANCSSSASQFRQAEFKTNSPCGTPTGLSVTNIATKSVTLNWNAVPNAIKYSIDYVAYNSNQPITVTDINALSYNLSGLTANTEYNWILKAYCEEGVGFYTMSYFRTASICRDNYETNNTSSQARSINVGSAISAGITTGTDIDWFRVTTPNTNNTNLTVSLSNLFADYDLYLYNKGLKLIGSSTQSDIKNEVVNYNSNSRKATYYIMVKSKYGAFDESNCYNLLVQTSNLPSSSSINVASQIELMDDKDVTQMGLMNEVDRQMLYPNPATGFINFGFNSTEEGLVNVQIVNSVGQLLKQSTVSVIKGFNLVKIPVNDIVPGMYLLRMNKGEMNITKRFMKVK